MSTIISILMMDKNGSYRDCQQNSTIGKLHELAGYKRKNGFDQQHIYHILLGDQEFSISLYGKSKGKPIDKSNHEYNIPSVTIFGNSLLCYEGVLSLIQWDEIIKEIFNSKTKEIIDNIKPEIKPEKDPVKGKNTKSENKKKSKVVKKIDGDMKVEEKPSSDIYLDCSKELDFEDYIVQMEQDVTIIQK